MANTNYDAIALCGIFKDTRRPGVKLRFGDLLHVLSYDEFYLPGSGGRRNPTAEYCIAEVDAAVQSGDWTHVDQMSFTQVDGTLLQTPYVDPSHLTRVSRALLAITFLHETCGVPLTSEFWFYKIGNYSSTHHTRIGYLQYLIDRGCPLPEHLPAHRDFLCDELLNNLLWSHWKATHDTATIIVLLVQLIDRGFLLPAHIGVPQTTPKALIEFLEDRGACIKISQFA